MMEQRLEGLEKSVAQLTELMSKLSMPPVRQNVYEDHSSLPTGPVPDMDDAMKATNAVASTFVQERFDSPKSLAQAVTLNSTSQMSFGKAVSGILRTMRDNPPVHYSFTIESFSLMQQMEVEKYESEVFEVERGKWRLCLYPNGNTKGNGKGHISLSIELEKDNPSPSNNWHLDVKLKFFVQDKINNKYLVVQDGEIKRFDQLNAEWGFDQFLSLEIFNSDSNGFLVNDCCTFGVEIFVLPKPTGECETLSMIKNPANGSLTWKIAGFSKLDKPFYHSPEFTAGERSWTLKVYPRGYEEGHGNFLSVFLQLAEADKLPPKKKVGAKFKLRILNQNQEKTLETTQFAWFSYPDIELWGQRKFIRLRALHEMSKGFVVDDDTLTVEVEILCISVSKKYSADQNESSSADTEILRAKRDAPPVHYSFTVESFSLMQQMEIEKYESEVFEVESEKWRLCLYPNGNTKGNGKGYISLSLELEKDKPSPPDNWHLDVELKLFVQDKINNKYLVVQDGKTKRFEKLNTEWCLEQFLPIEIFKNDSNGYLANDCCTFGVEIFVIPNPTGKCETLYMVKNPVNGSLTWKMKDFSKLDKPLYHSPEFTAGERSWKLKVYPRGYKEGHGNFLSVFLQLADADKLPPKKKVGAKFKLRVLNQNQEKNLETTHYAWFSFPDNEAWGQRRFVRLGDLHEMSKGFVVDDDTLTIEVEILCVSISKTIPSSEGAGIKKTKREHYTLTVESLSLLRETEVEYYESGVFEVEGKKWRLRLYPNGNTKGKQKGHISLSMILEIDEYPSYTWHFDVKLKFFVQDQINNKYLLVQDEKIRHFNENETEWGIDEFLSLATFIDASNGYLIKDCCTFGAEISVIDKKPTRKMETLSVVTGPAILSFTWRIEKFSKLKHGLNCSETFITAGQTWALMVYPEGLYSGQGTYLYFVLWLFSWLLLEPKKKVWAKFRLRAVNKDGRKNVEKTFSHWFDNLEYKGGSDRFIRLGDLHDTSKGFVTGGDTVTLEIDMLSMAVTEFV